MQDTFTSLDTDPAAWLTTSRLELARHLFADSSQTLRLAGLYRSSLKYWVRFEVAATAPSSTKAPPDELEKAKSSWLDKHDLKESLLSVEELELKLSVSLCIANWCRAVWSHRLPTLFLENKEKLDRVSCRLLRNSSKNIINELYHRIKANETTFQEAAFTYGQGPERIHNGLISLRPIANLPFGLASLVRSLEVGKMSNTCKISDDYCLVLLEESKPAALDYETEQILLSHQLSQWVDEVVELLIQQI